MKKGKCAHCKKRGTLSEVTMAFAGMRMSVDVCESCAAAFEKLSLFASTFPAAAPAASPAAPAPKRKPRPRSDPKFDGYALKPEEIKEIQKHKPPAVARSTPRQRDLDRADLLDTRHRVRIFDMGPGREKRIPNKAKKELGTDNVRVLSDNGFEALVEAVA